MEPLVALAHRAVMHRGRGWTWHASHHRAQRRSDRRRGALATGFEKNDRFPALFAIITVAMMAIGTSVDGLGALTWIGVGVTAYGAAYLLVHDGYVHARVGALPWRTCRYVRWVRLAHARHHASGGAPYGFLLPVTPHQRDLTRVPEVQ